MPATKDEPPTLFALSSGRPPAAIAVVRISGPAAAYALTLLTGRPAPTGRSARLRTIRHPITGDILDRGLVLFFPGPRSATGEDLAELHLHGGVAVIGAVLTALSGMEGLKAAEPGAFTRRAFENGILDLVEVEGLADLLSAETERQRRQATAQAGGYLSRLADQWREKLLDILAQVEAGLDFSDEGDVEEVSVSDDIGALAAELDDILARPSAERLREGISVAVIGAPNAGKSSLINSLAQRDVAIVTPVPGTTRDRIEAHVAIEGIPFTMIDTAGLRESEDLVEREGIARARAALASADMILAVAEDGDAVETLDLSVDDRPCFRIRSKIDLTKERPGYRDDRYHLSAITREGLKDLTDDLVREAASFVGGGEVLALSNDRQRISVQNCTSALKEALTEHDPVLIAERLREALTALGRLTGRMGVEDMLDSLFGRFCIGK